MQAIYLLKGTRNLMTKLVDGLTEAQLTHIPDGYNNNLLWHLGHVTVTQQLLHYNLSELPMYVDEDLCDLFRRGTSPRNWTGTPDIDKILSLLTELPERLVGDCEAGRFQAYKGLSTATGFEIQTIEDAIDFNNFHEGIHTGYMMAMKRWAV